MSVGLDGATTGTSRWQNGHGYKKTSSTPTGLTGVSGLRFSVVMTAAGATRRDIIHVAYGYGLFTGGLGAHYGAERLGATTIPMSGGSTRRQATLLRDFGATVLCCTPSYSLVLFEAAREAGIDFKELPLRIGIFGAEPWTDGMRKDIETKMGIKAIDIYGLSEVMGPGVAIECAEAQYGAHIMEDHFLCEIIDPDTKEVLPPGATGELVITTLTKEALPLIRYRTRDITRIDTTPCKCGRTFARMFRVQGRSDDMGTRSYILTGADAAADRAFASTCHGAGRAASRKKARKRFPGREVLAELAAQGISLRTGDPRGLGEEAPGAYKDIEDVVHTTHDLGLATKTARLRPLACIKG